MEKKLLENHKKYVERTNLYKNFGYDVKKEGKLILEKAHPLYGKILEIGTGKGHFASKLAKEGYKFTTIDISREEQKFARLNIKYLGLEKFVDFKIGDAEDLSFKDGNFDIVFSVNAIHHFANPFKAIDEMARVVNFKGKIILSDFTSKGLKIIDKINESEGRKHKAGKVKMENIKNYLLNKGFKAKKYKNKIQEILIAYNKKI